MKDRNKDKTKFEYGDILHDRKFNTCFKYARKYLLAITYNFTGRYTLATEEQKGTCVMEG